MLNKAALLCCGLLAAALLCASCGREAPPPEASSAPPPSVSDVSGPAASSVPEPDTSLPPQSPDPEELFMSHPIPLELPEGEVADDTVVPYTWDYSVTVDNGRQLTLRLRCEAEYRAGNWEHGVQFIDVLEEGSDHYLDRLSIHAADAVSRYQAGSDIDWAMEKTWHWTEDCGLTVEDLNFDGIDDLRLAAYTGVVNTNYLCWLWEPENQRFEYTFSLAGYDVRIDPEKQQIVTEDRDASTYTTKYYQYDKDGRLYLADSSSVTY